LFLVRGAAPAIARLNRAGVDVAICTNPPEVARGVMIRAQLDDVHEGLHRMLAARGAASSWSCAVPARASARR